MNRAPESGVYGMSTVRSSLARLAIAAVIVYLTAHALTGREGVLSVVALAEEEKHLAADLALLRGERDRLQDEAARLQAEGLDLDFLEERARGLVRAVRQDEILLPAP